jgi:hypothetical protein
VTVERRVNFEATTIHLQIIPTVFSSSWEIAWHQKTSEGNKDRTTWCDPSPPAHPGSVPTIAMASYVLCKLAAWCPMVFFFLLINPSLGHKSSPK